MNNFLQEEKNKIEENNEAINFLENSSEIYKQFQNINYCQNNNNAKDNSSFSFDSLENKKLYNSLITNITIDQNDQKENFQISFISLNNNDEKNKMNKKNELSEESIEILNDFISKEKKAIENNNYLKNNLNDKLINSNKELKNQLFSLDNCLCLFFKNPFMRNNLKKLYRNNTNFYSKEKSVNEGNIKTRKNQKFLII